MSDDSQVYEMSDEPGTETIHLEHDDVPGPGEETITPEHDDVPASTAPIVLVQSPQGTGELERLGATVMEYLTQSDVRSTESFNGLGQGVERLLTPIVEAAARNLDAEAELTRANANSVNANAEAKLAQAELTRANASKARAEAEAIQFQTETEREVSSST